MFLLSVICGARAAAGGIQCGLGESTTRAARKNRNCQGSFGTGFPATNAVDVFGFPS